MVSRIWLCWGQCVNGSRTCLEHMFHYCHFVWRGTLQTSVKFLAMHFLISFVYRIKNMTRTPKFGATEDVYRGACYVCGMVPCIVCMLCTWGTIYFIGYWAWSGCRSARLMVCGVTPMELILRDLDWRGTCGGLKWCYEQCVHTSLTSFGIKRIPTWVTMLVLNHIYDFCIGQQSYLQLCMHRGLSYKCEEQDWSQIQL